MLLEDFASEEDIISESVCSYAVPWVYGSVGQLEIYQNVLKVLDIICD